jgi:hypothetical protein
LELDAIIRSLSKLADQGKISFELMTPFTEATGALLDALVAKALPSKEELEDLELVLASAAPN